MIKGCQKKIIHLKNTNSPYFEEAYFILKDNSDVSVKENDMVREAERIAQSARISREKAKDNSRLKLIATVLAAVSCVSLIFAILMLCIALFA